MPNPNALTNADLYRQLLFAGHQPTTYAGFKSLRRAANSAMMAVEDDYLVYLTTALRAGARVAALVPVEFEADGVTPKVGSDYEDYVTTQKPFANASIACAERRFLSHNYCNRKTWDGRTTGLPPEAWVKATWPNAAYDDVNYRWVDNLAASLAGSGYTRYAYLDGHDGDVETTPAVWKDDAGNAIVSYDAEQDKWIQASNSADRTYSTFRVKPYEGKKLEIRHIVILSEKDVNIPSKSYFDVYMNVPPYGVIRVRRSVYKDIIDYRASNSRQHTDPAVPSSNFTMHPMSFAYDYNTTQPFTLDDLHSSYVEVLIDGHNKITGALKSIVGFITVEWDSF